MGRNINSSKLNKETILNKISQINIFSTYFNIPVNIINHCIDTGDLIVSPIRTDRHPTCGFRYDARGKLKFRDFAGYFWGDCFDAAAMVISGIYGKTIDINNKEDFIFVLRHISFTFKDLFYGGEVDETLKKDIYKSISLLKRKKPIIELVIRNWNKYDKNIWGKIDVEFEDLNIEFIYPVDQYYINRKTNPKPKYFYNTEDPCYAYYLGKDKLGIDNIKLYFPKRKKTETRFITNCNHLEGIYTLDRDDYDIIIITKSTKDRITIKKHIRKMKTISEEIKDLEIGVINIPHETYKLRQNEYNWLNSKIKFTGSIISLMDNDFVGIKQAVWLKTAYNIRFVLIPKKYESKDFAELKEKYSFNDVSNLVIKAIKYII